MNFQTINPVDNKVIAEYRYISKEVLSEKLSLSESAYANWRNTTFEYRNALLEKLTQVLHDNRRSYAALITREMGKPIAQSLAEVEKCIMLCRYYMDISERELANSLVYTDYIKSYVRFDPTGAVFGIMPWNFPFWQVFRYVIPNMMAGNVTLLKHAPNTMGCGEELEAIFVKSGFPEGVFQNLIIDIPQVEDVIASDIVSGVTLTGSDAAGRSVAQLAGKYMKKSVMELGGSDPYLIFKDSELRKAAKVGVLSRMMNTGQTCISAKRFIVHSSIAKEFATYVKKEIESLKLGDVTDFSTDIGVIARKDLSDKLQKQVQFLKDEGCEFIIDSTKEGNSFTPSLVKIYKDCIDYVGKNEVFGPVAMIIEADSDEEMIDIANNTPYGLGASIWSDDLDVAEKYASKIDAGCIAINNMVKSDPRLPFGGAKLSGYGRELSYYALKEFVNVKTVYINGV